MDPLQQIDDLVARVERLESKQILRTYKYIYTAEIAEDPNFSLDNRSGQQFSLAADDLTEALAGLLQVYEDWRIVSITRRDA